MSEEINEETGEEIDEEKEFIKDILLRTAEESFITSNYLLIEESALNFSFDDITEEDFVKVLTEMKETIGRVQEGYENAYMNLDRWTLEIATGDRMFREGIKEWDEGLDYLFEYCKDMDEGYINSGIKKIYEGNKKLIINQKIEEYVDEQVRLLQKEGKEDNVPSGQGEKEISYLSRPTEKPVITGTVIPVTGHMTLISKKEEKTEERLHPTGTASVPSIKISDKSLPSETVIPLQKSEKIQEKKISSDTVTTPQKVISEKIHEKKISSDTVTTPQKVISEKIQEEELITETVSPGPIQTSSELQEKEISQEVIDKPAEPEISEKEEQVEQTETEIAGETMDEKPLKKAIRKPAGLSKRVRKSSHGERKSSDISSDDDREKKSIRRPAGLSRKAARKQEE